MSRVKITFSTENNFKSCMAQYAPVVDLDNITSPLPTGAEIADYAIKDVVVIELKTLKENPKSKMEDHFHKIMQRHDFPLIFGELNFHKVVGLMPDGQELIRKFETIAFRQIESIISKANKQINSTILSLNMNTQTAGVLVIINEFANFFEPDVLVDYISHRLSSKNDEGLLRFSHINSVVLLQDTHRVSGTKINGIVVPIYEIENDNIPKNGVTYKAKIALEDLFESFSLYNKFKHKKLEDPLAQFEIQKIEPDIVRQPLKGQAWIEDQYRKNRYMKDYSDKQMIEYGSMVISMCHATVLKVNPLRMNHDKKMNLFRNLVELFEESRLRPFDLRRLDIDPMKYTPK